MRRDVSTHLALTVAGPATLLFSTAVSATGMALDETFALRVDGQPVEPTTFTDHYGSRLHQTACGAARVTLDYTVTAVGEADVLGADPIDLVSFLRPSRYCESDTLAPTADAEFRGLEGHALLGGGGELGPRQAPPTSPVPASPPTAPSRHCWPGRGSAATSRT